MRVILLTLVLAILLSIGPLLLIWAVNMLASGSGFQIAYGFSELLAALVLIVLMNAKQ